MLRHAESAPAEDVGDTLNIKTFLPPLCWPHLAAMTCIRPGDCAVCQESIRAPFGSSSRPSFTLRAGPLVRKTTLAGTWSESPRRLAA